MEVTNIFLTEHYDFGAAEKVPTAKKWLGREGLQLVQTLKQVEQESC